MRGAATRSREARAEAADSIATGIIDSVPLRLARAHTEPEIEAMQRLRADVVVEMGWAPAARFPDGLERDAYDERAVHVGAWEEDLLVGTSRVIPPDSEGRLPLETDFGVELENPERFVEVGRTAIIPARRGDARHALVVALFAHCWLELRALGRVDLVANLPSKLIDLYTSLGFRIEPLGGARMIWGEERLPVQFDVLGSIDSLEAVWFG